MPMTMPLPTPAAPAQPTVIFDQVSKRYGPVTAVDQVSFAIDQGTLVTLLGPSGCGKTTTLRMIAGLEFASQGRILIGGVDVTHQPASERDVSMVFQSYALFPHMTVMENVCYGLRAGGLGRAEAEARAADKLAAVGLSGFERRLPSELSGGQQQRVAVARAIVLEPQVLLFDEPLSNLDAKMRRRVREDIRSLQQSLGLTVVYVTHDQEEALAVSDRVIVMHERRIVQDGSPRDLYERPASRFVADFIGNANILPVVVASAGQGMARISFGRAVWTLPDSGLSADQRPAASLALALRPEAIRLSTTASGDNLLPGVIRKAAYLGNHMEYEVLLDGHDNEIFVVDPDVFHPLAPGTRIAASIDPRSAVLVPNL